MKCLVVGGAGYIGSHMAHYLKQKGYEVIVFDNLELGHKEHINNIKLVEGDLKNIEDIKKALQENEIDTIYHFAAYSLVPESMTCPEKYFENNVLGSLNLLKAMSEFRIKNIVFSSTCAVYGIPKKIPITENENTNPISPYGESKLFIEKMIKWFGKIHGIKYSILRYFNVAGAGFGIGEKHDPETHLIPITIEAALGKRKNLKVFGTDYQTRDGTCIRDYIDIIDLCEAHLLAAKHEGSGIFNLGTGNGTSVREIIDLVKDISGKNFVVEETEKREGDPPVLIADYQKAEKVLGWKPTTKIKQTIKNAWEWHSK